MEGKAKELFEEWYSNEISYKKENAERDLKSFRFMKNSFQWGVYQDFADSLGYKLMINPHYPCAYEYIIYVFNENKNKPSNSPSNKPLITHEEDGVWYETRNEARQKAIEKLNEIINNESKC